MNPVTPLKIRLAVHRPLAAVIVTVTLASGMALSTAPSAAAAVKDPVVFVHGLNNNSGVWKTAEDYFTNHGYSGQVFAFDYRDTTQERVEDNADRLWSWMKSKGLESKRVNVVGHSMGGLVARKMALNHAGDFTLGSLVTLATPNHGSYFADLCPGPEPEPRHAVSGGLMGLCNTAVRQMRTGSKFLNKLNLETESQGAYAPDNTLTYSITDDEMVDGSSVRLRGADNRRIDKDAAEAKGGSEVHTSITRKKQVLQDALTFIKAGDDPAGSHKLSGGPGLRDADCTIWNAKHGTVRWDLPRNAPSDLKAEVTSNGHLWGTVPASDQGVVDRLGYGTHSIRFVDGRKGGYTSAYSTVTFHAGTWRCDSTITNANSTVQEWPVSEPITAD
ncbi:esterase/lipase family protein [Streptomyces tubercidicus]|uniref:Lipase n=1 Tax=Streptomyces tubercidicus TaxID=47759 RepID=A0A640UJK4_9ACTN|nr:alpha/beta fold hydrolase [Streptomyces tubercidicus]WAU11033.1 lipase family protein [Streptomyces tubercidicus]GFE36238.1 hypothetical protein Stube_09110 [Streptomyces tubercidicus]